MTAPFRVFVIDEHPVVRAGLAQLFASSSDYLFCGAAANASFSNDVAVFTTDEAGLMVEASIGGQGFSFQPK